MSRRRDRADGQPRKQPTGSKGRAIVDAIVDAARLILDEQGYEALTSNRIAERAGVSIGSFYQYFPNTEAVVGELARDIERRSLAMIRQRLRDTDNPVAMIEDALDVLLSPALGALRTRALLLREVPRAWIREVSYEVDGEVIRLVRDRLVAFADRLADVGDPEIGAFVLVTSVEAVVESCVDRHPEWLENGMLRRHLRKFMLRFLGLDDGD